MSNLPDTGSCQMLFAGFRIPDPYFGRIKRLRGAIFSINIFSTMLHIRTRSKGTMNVIQIQRYTFFFYFNTSKFLTIYLIMLKPEVTTKLSVVLYLVVYGFISRFLFSFLELHSNI